MIDIFWIIGEKLIAKKVNLSEIKEINGFKDMRFVLMNRTNYNEHYFLKG